MTKRYWSCTKFADIVRGTKKPESATLDQWNSWSKQAKEQHPIRFCIAEEVLDVIQNFVLLPAAAYNKVNLYAKNRWLHHTHSLQATSRHLKRGKWAHLSERFLPCLFDSLVDFVEIECAQKEISSAKGSQLLKYKSLTKRWRCQEAGLNYLSFLSKAGDDPRSAAVGEIIVLYNWWKNVHPFRKDAALVSPFNVEVQEIHLRYYGFPGLGCTQEESLILDKHDEAKKQAIANYQEEDTQMMIKLIKVRDHLWT